MNKITIPLYQPDLTGNEKAYLNECIDTSWVSWRGRFVTEFENRFAQRAGTVNAISVCNGTLALHLALLALGIGPEDEVIVPTLTYVASANVVMYCGATPVFVDSDRDTWQVDPEDIRRHITPRTRAIMPVHLYGQACEMDAIMAIAREHRLFVIEDCAEALGTLYRGRHVGSFGDISGFSFFGNKTITTGEGGMVVTDDQTLAQRSRHFRGQGLADHREYWHDVVGYNYRMTNVAAAIGLAQLERMDSFLAAKRRLAALYRRELAGLPLRFQGELPHTEHSHWMVSVVVDKPADRDPLRAHLAAAGIETRPLFYPVHTMPMYAKTYRRHPVAEDLAWRGVNLPSWPGLSDDALARICDSVRGYFRGRAA
ncbi:MAG: aminotransferase class I/II-fold pyridoxal phosphate-dependent enzyme [Rubrivivax sp.]|nr:aminotransferase class I/II-fold pyridoxal phosphate-dependent enzyme [Rubrivivax sp.]